MKTKPEEISDIAAVCPSFPQWPRRWMGMPEDVPYGAGILKVFAPFIRALMSQGYSERTISKHCDNLWLLGGEIIREVSLYDEYETEPRKMVINAVDSEGGMDCRHLHSRAERLSYNNTCKMLHAFLHKRREKRPNKSVQPTPTAVTPRAKR
jgi:hypothetical protein